MKITQCISNTICMIIMLLYSGHYDCGGVRAAMESVDHKSPLENWLRNIRDIYRLHMKELNAIPDATQRQRRLVELNVIEQVPLDHLTLFDETLTSILFLCFCSV